MALSALVDTNVLVRHLTGDPPEQAARATRFLAKPEELLLPDVIFAECVYVLESVYELDRVRVHALMSSVLGFEAVRVISAPLLDRALGIYRDTPVDFEDAYLAATAERIDLNRVASFDRHFDRIEGIRRIEP